MKKLILLSVLIVTALINAGAQAPTCSPNVPFYSVDFTGNPTGTWVSPGHSRDGNCCNTNSPDRCTSFEIITDTNTAMISFEIASGAVPTGSMFYQINCGPQIPVGQPICITGVGPHYLTFCKPGNNQNTYRVTSIARPTFPPDDTTRIGCSHVISLLGMVDSSCSWTSIYPGAPGDYNSYLNCTSSCDTTYYSPAANAPPMVEYLVCGLPQATLCGYVYVCDTVRMYNQQPLSGTILPNPGGFCQGGPGIVINASGSGGLSPYTYVWRDQSMNITCNTASCLITNAGIYSVEIGDALNDSTYCPSIYLSATVIVTPPPIVNAGPDQTLCPTNPVVVLNGSVQYAMGGVWSGGAGTFSPSTTSLLASYTPTAAEIAAGQVTLTLTSTGAGGGCVDDSDQLTIYFPAPIAVNVANVNVGCSGGSGTLSSVVSGGIMPYTYQWSTGQTTSSIIAGQGTYCLTVTDILGCSSSDCGTVTTPSALNITVTSTPCSVNGGNDGTATATVTGGTAPYTYLWSNGGSTATITGLTYGIYSVTATDANGCTIVSSVVVNEPRCNAFSATGSSTNVTCFGDNDGSATATNVNGTGPFSYLWSPSSQTSSTATNLTSGVYQCAITDANGCLASVNITITQPTQLINTMTHVNASTVGGTDGSASTNASGGTPAYTYSWSTGATTSSINTLGAGTYSVTITDGQSCSLTDSVQINEPPCSNLTAGVAATHVSCNGGNNGTATAVVIMGVNPISYLWSTGATTSSISGLAAGNYSVTIIDGIGCSTFVNFAITEPSPLSIALSATDIRCESTNDGTIELTVSGGVFPYTYVWTNGLPTEDLINLSNGSYTVIVTDANGCSVTNSATINRPTAVTIATVTSPVTCNGGADGSIDATVGGGIAPYTYSWSNGPTTQDISGLTSGEYLLIATDANNCSTQAYSTLIDQPDTVTIASVIVACPVPGSGQAEVTMNASGGNSGSYQFSTDGGFTWLAPGVYSVFLPVDSNYTIAVRDTFGCAGFSVFSLSIAPEAEITAIGYTSCIPDGASNIPVTISVTGGSGGPLSASFDNGATWLAPGVYTSNLATGATYSIIVRDSSGCVSTTTSITLSTDIVLNGTMSSYAGGFNIDCQGSATGSIDLNANGGTGTYTYNWSNSTASEDIINVMAGSYSVVVTDEDGCADTIAFTLTEPTALAGTIVSANNYNGYDISCAGGTNGAIDLSITGGVAGYTYLWTNSATTEDISGLNAGSYSAVVTDANGCILNANISLTEPPALAIASVQQDVLCNSFATGSIDLTTSGGVSTYTYAWSNSATTEDVSALAAGAYNVMITDLNGCTISGSFIISEPTAIATTSSLSDYNGYNITCNGSNDGSINLGVTGGTPGYTYNWSDGSTNEDLSGASAGSYTVVISDANGCTNTQTFTLAEPTAVAGTILSANNYNGYEISCNGSNDGGVNLTVTGGVTAYTYNWSNGGNTEDISNLLAGSYSVTVTDLNGCTYTTSIELSEPAALVNTANVQGVPCNGYFTGTIDLTTTGGVTPYDYNWSNGQQTQDIANLGAGTYTVVATDANGCIINSTYTISELAAVTVTSQQASPLCNGESNASIDLNITGGTAPYTYTWSNGAATQDLSNISEGTYIVTVTDNNNCYATDTFYLVDPLVLIANANSPVLSTGYNISHYGKNDGSIDLEVEGGTPPYSYQWNNGATTQDLAGLTAGTYSVIITDANGCQTTDAITLTEPLGLEMPTGFSPNGDGQNDYFEVHGIEAFPKNTIEVYNRWGNLVWDGTNYNNTWNGTNEAGAELPDGTYFVILNINNDENVLKGYVDIRR